MTTTSAPPQITPADIFATETPNDFTAMAKRVAGNPVLVAMLLTHASNSRHKDTSPGASRFQHAFAVLRTDEAAHKWVVNEQFTSYYFPVLFSKPSVEITEAILLAQHVGQFSQTPYEKDIATAAAYSDQLNKFTREFLTTNPDKADSLLFSRTPQIQQIAMAAPGLSRDAVLEFFRGSDRTPLLNVVSTGVDKMVAPYATDREVIAAAQAWTEENDLTRQRIEKRRKGSYAEPKLTAEPYAMATIRRNTSDATIARELFARYQKLTSGNDLFVEKWANDPTISAAVLSDALQLDEEISQRTTDIDHLIKKVIDPTISASIALAIEDANNSSDFRARAAIACAQNHDAGPLRSETIDTLAFTQSVKKLHTARREAIKDDKERSPYEQATSLSKLARDSKIKDATLTLTRLAETTTNTKIVRGLYLMANPAVDETLAERAAVDNNAGLILAANSHFRARIDAQLIRSATGRNVAETRTAQRQADQTQVDIIGELGWDYTRLKNAASGVVPEGAKVHAALEARNRINAVEALVGHVSRFGLPAIGL